MRNSETTNRKNLQLKRLMICATLVFALIWINVVTDAAAPKPIPKVTIPIEIRNLPTYGGNLACTGFYPLELLTQDEKKKTVKKKDQLGIVYSTMAKGGFAAHEFKSGKLIWKYKAGNTIYGQPAIANGLVYFGSHDSHLYGLNASTGKLIWKFKTNGFLLVSPVIWKGMVYFGSSSKTFYALKADTGKEVWSFKSNGHIYTSPCIHEGLVYFGSTDFKLYVRDAKTGEAKWSVKTGGSINNACTIDNSKVYLLTSVKNLCAYSIKDHSLKWRTEVGYCSYCGLTLEDGVIFGITKTALFALEAETGNKKWTKILRRKSFSNPSTKDGILYLTTKDGFLMAFTTKDGKEKWSFNAGKGFRYCTPAIVDEMVYAGSDNKYLYGINAETGKKVWATECEFAHRGGTAVATNYIPKSELSKKN